MPFAYRIGSPSAWSSPRWAAACPSNWYGLVGANVSEVERLSSCLQRHSVELAALVTSLGDPTSLLNATPSAREHAVHAAERRGDLQPREASAVVACARTVTGQR